MHVTLSLSASASLLFVSVSVSVSIVSATLQGALSSALSLRYKSVSPANTNLRIGFYSNRL